MAAITGVGSRPAEGATAPAPAIYMPLGRLGDAGADDYVDDLYVRLLRRGRALLYCTYCWGLELVGPVTTMVATTAVALVLAAFVAAAAAQGTAHDRDKLTSEYNASIIACGDRGFEGVIVELVDPSTGGRRQLHEPGPRRKSNVAQTYLERLSERVRSSGRGRRSLSELLVVHATFSEVIDGFAATLDDEVLDLVLNETSEVLGIEANW